MKKLFNKYSDKVQSDDFLGKIKGISSNVFPYLEMKELGKVTKVFLTILILLSGISTLVFTSNFLMFLTSGYGGELITWLFFACALLYIVFYVFLIRSIKGRDVVALIISEVAIISCFVLTQGILAGVVAGLVWTIPLYFLKKSYKVVI